MSAEFEGVFSLPHRYVQLTIGIMQLAMKNTKNWVLTIMNYLFYFNYSNQYWNYSPLQILIEIKQIIDCLTASELQFLIHSYRSKPQIHEKKLLLLTAILEKKIHTDWEASRLIYDQPPTSAYSHLKKRLKEDLLNTLLQKNSGSLPETKITAEIKARKLHLQALLLKQLGRCELASQLIKKALRISIDYELLDFQLAIYDFQTANDHDRQKSEQHIDSWNKSMSAIDKLKEIHFARSSISTSWKQVPKFRPKEELSNSGLVQFWNCKKELHQFKKTKEFGKAYTSGLKAVSVVKDKSQIFKCEEVFIINLEMAKICLYQNKPDHSAEFATKAFEISYSEESEYEALEMLFYAHFIKKDWSKAGSIISRVVEGKRYCSGEMNRWQYYSANLQFINKRFKDSIKSLNQQAGPAGENGRNFQFSNRLLEIMNLVELKDYDWLQFRMESFRKSLQLTRPDSNPRFMSIFKLIRALIKNNFNFDQTYKMEINSLDLLKSGRGKYYRDPLGFELHDTCEWFVSKCNTCSE